MPGQRFPRLPRNINFINGRDNLRFRPLFAAR